MKVTDFSIGDQVMHLSDPLGRWKGTVVALHLNLDLVRVAWAGGTRQEWVTPDEVRMKALEQ